MEEVKIASGQPTADSEYRAPLVSQFQPDHIPGGVWIGIDDIEIIRALTNGLGLPYPKETVAYARDELTVVLETIFGRDNLLIIPASNLRARILRLADQLEGGSPHIMTVTLEPGIDPEMPILHMTRLANRQGEIIGRGPRPGAPPLRTQMAQLYKIAQREGITQVRLIDDVVMGGGSAIETIRSFREYGLEVVGIIGGVVKVDAAEKVRREGVEVEAVVLADPSIRDVVTLRDLLPSIPLAGFQLGQRVEEDVIPFTSNNIPFRPPYLAQPGEVPIRRASIPPEVVDLVSDVGWSLSLKMFQALGDLNGRALTLGDLSLSELPAGFPGLPPKGMIKERRLNLNIPVEQVIEHKRGKALGEFSSHSTIVIMSSKRPQVPDASV